MGQVVGSDDNDDGCRCRYLVAKGIDPEAASYALYTGHSGGLFFFVYDGKQFVLSPDAGRGIWDGHWHHVAGTFDGASVRLYVDGTQVGLGTPTGSRSTTTCPMATISLSATFSGRATGDFRVRLRAFDL